MEAFYKDNHNTIYCLDFRKNDLPDECVQMVCTSPPYWGLRKYSGEQELIWGDNHCEHNWVDDPVPGEKSGLPGPNATVGARFAQDAVRRRKPTNTCSLCGAWKGAYGLEPTPEMYIEHTIEILREIRRVLRKDGVVFWNIGDSYFGGISAGKQPKDTNGAEGARQTKDTPKICQHCGVEFIGYPMQRFCSDACGGVDNTPRQIKFGMKPKDLCLIPFRVAISAQNDGWWVRSVIIWSKPNPMPESVTDRPTESHEYILMLTKSGTTQYWTHPRKRGSRTKPKPDYIWAHKRSGLVVDYQPVSDRILKEFWTRRNLWRGHDYYWDADAVREPHLPQSLERVKHDWNGQRPEMSSWAGMDIHKMCHPSGRNIRSVWEFPTQSYPEAHFAVFPEKLPELCIKAATPEVGCCSKCGAPWERVLDKRPSAFNIRVRDAKAGRATPEEGYKATQDEIDNYPGNHPDPGYHQTIGWQPTCKCNADKVPSIVLDPLMGAGTTLWVAKKLNRRAVGYEISEEYCSLAVDRCRQQVLL